PTQRKDTTPRHHPHPPHPGETLPQPHPSPHPTHRHPRRQQLHGRSQPHLLLVRRSPLVQGGLSVGRGRGAGKQLGLPRQPHSRGRAIHTAAVADPRQL